MGSSSAKSSFQENNWRFVQQLNHKTILFNDATSKSIEKHEAIIYNPYDEIKEIYEWRSSLDSQSPIVQVYEYGVKEVGICNGQSQIYAITERVHLFEQMIEITQAQSLMMIKEVIFGLQTLFLKFGFFSPYSGLFGINNDGKTKIWVNQNFSLCSALPERVPLDQSQLQIVNNIVRIITSKVYYEPNEELINYPFNMDFQATISYINNIISRNRDFYIDRIYRDREEYVNSRIARKEKRQRDAKSRLYVLEAEQKQQEIQKLKILLQKQQRQFAQKEITLKNQQQIINQNSQKKVLKNTATTVQSHNNQPQPHIAQRKAYNIPCFPPPVPRKMNMQEGVLRMKQRNNENMSAHDSLRKQIEMVDSMLLVQQDNVEQRNKRYVESRVVGQPRGRQLRG